MKLPAVNAKGFGKLVHWLYTKQLEVEHDTADPAFVFLYDMVLWRASVEFEVNELYNILISKIIQQVKAPIGSDFHIIKRLITTAYIPKFGTPLRKLAVEKLAWGNRT